MSTKQAEVFSQVLRVGVLEGKSVGSIVSQLKGRLRREQAGTVDSIIASGGQVTAMPNNQIRAIVRTSVNQVVDAAEELVALQNPDITKKYRYTALLDSKTTPICRALDGKVYEWGKGPKPPQHFGCRSRRVSLTTGFAARTFRCVSLMGFGLTSRQTWSKKTSLALSASRTTTSWSRSTARKTLSASLLTRTVQS